MSRQYVFTSYGGPDGERLTQRQVPDPGPRQVTVQVRAAGVNPVDWKIREGLLGRHEPVPMPMGREVAGVVTAVGTDAGEVAVGDAVLGLVAHGEGGFADHAVLDVADLVPKPSEVPFPVAATLPVAGTAAYDLTHQIELEQHQSLLILGAGGGVGHLAAQIGHVHQFRVFGVAAPAKRALVESTGATFVAAGAGAAQAVRDLVPGGVDLLVDLVGGQALRDLAPAVRIPERIVSAADPETAAALGGTGRETGPGTLRKVTDVVAHDLITPHMGHVFPLERAREALAQVESGHATGKVVIEP